MELNLLNSWVGLGTLFAGLVCLVVSSIVWKKSRKSVAPLLMSYLQEADDLADFHLAVEKALRSVVADTKATAGYVMLQSAGSDGQLQLASHYSPDKDFVAATSLGLDEGISGLCVSTKQSILVKGRQHSALISEEFAKAPTSVIAIPLNFIEGATSAGASIEQPTGVLILVTDGKTKVFERANLDLAAAYGTVMSMLVHNIQMIEFSRETILSSLQEIADFLDAKDPFSVGHSRRTAEIAEAIAEQLGVEEEVCREIRAGAQLLDLGKVAIPDSILKKNSGLTAEEFDVVRGHSLVSYEICRKLRMPESVLLIVRNHHERLDGSGYPDQMRGGELPLPLRIVCVADAYDAMRCARPHRAGLTSTEALQELVQEAGTKFDPVVIEAVRDLTEAGVFESMYSPPAPDEAVHLRVA